MTATTREYGFHPLAEEYPPMPADELARMELAMRQSGFDPHFPVVLYGGLILDGRSRYQAARAAGVEPIYVEFTGTPQEAALFAQTANEDRRHLAEGWLSRRRRERVERVAAARQGGKSTRAIAAEEGVSQAQVLRDLGHAAKSSGDTPPVSPEGDDDAAPGVPGGDTPEGRDDVLPGGHTAPTWRVRNGSGAHPAADGDESDTPFPEADAANGAPARVAGTDGKSYPARKPRTARVKAPQGPGKDEAGAEGENVEPRPPAPPRDAWGIPVQPHAAEAFATLPDFKRVAGLLRQAQKELTALVESPGGKHLLRLCQWIKSGAGGRWSLAALDNAVRELESSRPSVTDCPYAYNPDRPHPEDCTLCRNLRWLPSPKGHQIPPTLTAAMKAHYGAGEGE